MSGSAGAVGGMVGQLAKQVFNCRVLGSCGGPKKCQFVKVLTHRERDGRDA